jgi:hypothetical protein
VETTGDLVRFGCSLRIECTSCHAAHTLSAVEVGLAHGKVSLASLAPCLKCRRCNRKEAKLIVLPPV